MKIITQVEKIKISRLMKSKMELLLAGLFIFPFRYPFYMKIWSQVKNYKKNENQTQL